MWCCPFQLTNLTKIQCPKTCVHSFVKIDPSVWTASWSIKSTALTSFSFTYSGNKYRLKTVQSPVSSKRHMIRKFELNVQH